MSEILKQYYNRYGGFWECPGLLDFCYLVNPYFTRCGIIDEIQRNFRALVTEYPAGIGVNSRLASKCWNVKEEFIIPGNGAAELIKILMESLEGKIGIVRPTFEEYPNRLKEDRLEVYISNKAYFRYNADDLINYFSEHKIETLVLINPDNPSGNFIPPNDLVTLFEWTKENGIGMILDESFVDFSVGFEKNSCIDNTLLEEYPNLIVIKSISKSYGIPGLRLGILCSSNIKLIANLKKSVSIWNINSFAEFFMQIFPNYRDDYQLACKQFIQTRADFEKELRTLRSLIIMPSQANYFFVEVLPPYNPVDLCEQLLKRYNILVSACLAKKGIASNRYMRIAVRAHSDNLCLITALRDILEDNTPNG